ncbi:MAG TPA: permease [Anaerolineaceae bacterium]|nr:permease [Anaerolineaceae bacterium]
MKSILSRSISQDIPLGRIIGILLAVIILVVFLSFWPPVETAWSTFTTVFLGIFIEALPYLLLGTLASGTIEVFVSQDAIQRLSPRSPILGALFGSALGIFFPVCECGVIPLVRRLFRKGLPIPAGVAFLLAAPVINPIVILSTATAFGFGRMLLLRVGFTLLIAFLTGCIFAVVRTPWEILRPTPWITAAAVEESNLEPHDPEYEHDHEHDYSSDEEHTTIPAKLRKVFLVSLDEFFEMGRYLVMGGLIAAGMQTFIPQSVLLGIGRGPVISVLALMALAILLSICSTVDSFVALSFVGIFSAGSVLAFLLYGPMVDIKSTLMFLRVFRSRPVIYLVVIPFLLVALVGVAINYFVAW